MINQLSEKYDLVVIGGGPAGMAAALSAQSNGISSILIIERDEDLGGILLQCIHAGFGLHVFKEELTGPEYAHRYLEKILDTKIDFLTRCFVTAAKTQTNESHPHLLDLRSSTLGLRQVKARALILAMGCRERTRQAIHIPGTRPSGVMTAGLAQKMVNIHGYLPGKRIAILGSGDIGLIMARRLALEGAEVLGVFELMPYSNGLTRNIVQCLDDYQIPLELSTTVTRINGSKRLCSIDVTKVDENRQILPNTKRTLDCDTLLLSIGLIPEIEIANMLGLSLHPLTQGPAVDSKLHCSTPGVFACGNVLHVHDLADNVSLEAERAGKNAATYLKNGLKNDDISLQAGKNVRYTVPQSICKGSDHFISLRVTQPLQNVTLRLGNILEKKLRIAIPSEMIHFKVSADQVENCDSKTLNLSLDE